MNNKFLDEAKLISEKLIGEKFNRNTASMMECQRLHNETGTWDCCDECKIKEKEELIGREIMWYQGPFSYPVTIKKYNKETKKFIIMDSDGLTHTMDSDLTAEDCLPLNDNPSHSELFDAVQKDIKHEINQIMQIELNK